MWKKTNKIENTFLFKYYNCLYCKTKDLFTMLFSQNVSKQKNNFRFKNRCKASQLHQQQILLFVKSSSKNIDSLVSFRSEQKSKKKNKKKGQKKKTLNPIIHMYFLFNLSDLFALLVLLNLFIELVHHLFPSSTGI